MKFNNLFGKLFIYFIFLAFFICSVQLNSKNTSQSSLYDDLRFVTQNIVTKRLNSQNGAFCKDNLSHYTLCEKLRIGLF